jgi:hypothetical protein
VATAAASVGAPLTIARRVLATGAASARTDEKTAASSASFVRPRTLNQWRWLMHVARKLTRVLNARRRIARRRS